MVESMNNIATQIFQIIYLHQFHIESSIISNKDTESMPTKT
jgi:hypothetical protein